MRIIFLVTCLCFCTGALACKKSKLDPWYLDEDKLNGQAKSIFLGQVVRIQNNDHGYQLVELKVIKVIKGIKLKSNQVLESIDTKNGSSSIVTLTKDCRPVFKFEMDKQYRVIMDIVNPHSFKMF